MKKAIVGIIISATGTITLLLSLIHNLISVSIILIGLFFISVYGEERNA